MMHPLNPVRSKLPRLAILLAGVACLGLAGCDDHAGDPKAQIGANPVLPALQQYLMPPNLLLHAKSRLGFLLNLAERRSMRLLQARPLILTV